MKFLPSTTDPTFGWQDFTLLVAVIAIPGICFFIWVAFFRKQPRRRKHRRHRRRSSHSAFARTSEWSSAPRTDPAPGEPKS